MLPPAKSARSIASYAWPAGELGDPGQWPLPLRLAAGILLNSPLPMLLAWGPQRAVLINDAYAVLAGPGHGHGRAPGGSVPLVLPPPLAAGHAAFERAWRGEATLQPATPCAFTRSGSEGEPVFDLYFTPVPGDDGQVGGVLCSVSPTSTNGTPDPGRAGAAAVAASDPDQLRILVVEDNLDAQYLVCEMLKAFGHEVDGVAHPSDALARLAAARYDVLFSDVSLPGMSGVELARQALQHAPALKVIFASGYGDTLLRHLDFPYLSLQKPYELHQLQEALAAVRRGPDAPA